MDFRSYNYQFVIKIECLLRAGNGRSTPGTTQNFTD